MINNELGYLSVINYRVTFVHSVSMLSKLVDRRGGIQLGHNLLLWKRGFCMPFAHGRQCRLFCNRPGTTLHGTLFVTVFDSSVQLISIICSAFLLSDLPVRCISAFFKAANGVSFGIASSKF